MRKMAEWIDTKVPQCWRWQSGMFPSGDKPEHEAVRAATPRLCLNLASRRDDSFAFADRPGT